jgi:EpsI family protein
MRDIFGSSAARLVTVFLVLQAAVMYSSMRPENVPPGRPLVGFPAELGGWRVNQEGVIDQETRDALKADDLLSREYGSPAGARASLFIAAFQSQRNGKTPHSPKNCLPGNGYSQLSEGEYPIDLGVAGTKSVNRFVVSRGESRSVVMYWYQSRDRVVASEFQAKFWVMADSVRLNRTDSALVRVVVPIINRDEDGATRTAVEFIKAFYPSVRQFLPA